MAAHVTDTMLWPNATPLRLPRGYDFWRGVPKRERRWWSKWFRAMRRAEEVADRASEREFAARNARPAHDALVARMRAHRAELKALRSR